MSGVSTPVRSRATLLLFFLLLVWLLGLSLAAVVSFRYMTELASRDQLDAGMTRLQVLEARVTELSDVVQVLQARPKAATAAALEEVRQTLETRLVQLEQAQNGHAESSELDALRTEIEQLRASLTNAHPATPIQPQTKTRPRVATKPREELFPFRIVNEELRSGHRTLSIAPVSNALTAGQIQVILPGEVVGPWRLDGIEGNTAMFRAGKQTRRLVIP